jgi:hypothetical protein
MQAYRRVAALSPVEAESGEWLAHGLSSLFAAPGLVLCAVELRDSGALAAGRYRSKSGPSVVRPQNALRILRKSSAACPLLFV